MKNFFKGIGKAFLYFMVYLGTQMLAGGVLGVVTSIRLTKEMMATGDAVDAMALSESMMEEVMAQVPMAMLIAGVLALLTYWIVFLIRKKNFFNEVDICAIPVKGILPIVLLGISINYVISVLINTIPFPDGWMESYMEASAPIAGDSLMAWLSTVVMAPILEEVVFRGLVYKRMKKGMPAIVAAIIATLLFGLMHGAILWVLYAAAFGGLLIWVYERYQSLTASILFHFAFNLTGMALSTIMLENEILIWVLFAVCVVAAVGSIVWNAKITKDIPKKEEAVEAVEIPVQQAEVQSEA